MREHSSNALRGRIVSTRFMAEGEDPYFSKWIPGLDDRFLDACEGSALVNRSTVTPLMLFLHMPLQILHYRQIKWIWFIFQYLLVIGILFLSYKLVPENRKHLIVLILSVFFSVSSFFHFHIERGQAYLLYVFLFLLVIYLTLKGLRWGWLLAGILAAIMVFLRPTYVILSLAFLFFGKFRFAAASAGTAIAILLIYTFTGNLWHWHSYVSAMQEWTAYNFGEMRIVPLSYEFPSYGEGMELCLWGKNYNFENLSFQGIIFEYTEVKVFPPYLWLAFSAAVLILVFVFAKKIKSIKDLFILILVLVMLFDFFLPAYRYTYNLVQWAPLPVLLLMEEKINGVSSILFLLGFIAITFFYFFLPHNAFIGECFFFLAAGVSLLIWTEKEESYS